MQGCERAHHDSDLISEVLWIVVSGGYPQAQGASFVVREFGQSDDLAEKEGMTHRLDGLVERRNLAKERADIPMKSSPVVLLTVGGAVP